MKQLSIILLISFIPILSFGQSEYYSTDSLTCVGVTLIDGGDLINSKLCHVKIGNKSKVYTPYEVKEFGFKDGRVYVSKEIHTNDSTQSVFLKRLYNGKAILYYYKGKGIKTFFVQKDSSLFVEIPKQKTKDDFSKQLLSFTTDCPNITEACSLVNYNSISLSKFFLWYNNCEVKPFPHLKYGFLLAYEYFKLKSPIVENEDLKYFDYNYNSGFSIGFFVDNPIRISSFSLRSELLLSKHHYSCHKSMGDIDLDYAADLASLNIPVLIKFTSSYGNIRPFMNAGIIGMYYFKNNTTLYKTTYVDNKPIIYDLSIKYIPWKINPNTGEKIYSNEPRCLISNLSLGYNFGGGIEFKLNYRNSLFLEIRYQNTFGFEDCETPGLSGFNLVTGIHLK